MGITPMRALSETVPRSPGQDLLLLYRARSRQELIRQGELDRIARHRGARVRSLLGDEIALTATSFHRLVPGLLHRDVSLCGLPGMSAAVRRALKKAGLPDRQLHEERFAFS